MTNSGTYNCWGGCDEKKTQKLRFVEKICVSFARKTGAFFFLVLKVGSGAKHGVLNDCNLQVVRLWP